MLIEIIIIIIQTRTNKVPVNRNPATRLHLVRLNRDCSYITYPSHQSSFYGKLFHFPTCLLKQ